MAQNTVQSTDALYLEDVIIYYATYSTSLTDDVLTDVSGATWNNIGSVSEFTREGASETGQPASMNVEHQQVMLSERENLTINLQEIAPTVINALRGSPAQSLSVTGASTSTSDTYAADAAGADKFYPFQQQSWSSTSAIIPIASTSVVVSGTSTWVDIQDYSIVQDANSYYGIIFPSTGAHSSTEAITIAYTLDTRTSVQLWYGDADELTPVMIKTNSVYSDGRSLVIYYPRVECTNPGAIADKAQGSGEFKDVSIQMQAREHETWSYNSRKQYKVEVFSTA